MGRLCWALLGLLSIACSGADGATHQQLRTSTAGPAFLWSDAGEYFLRGPKQAAGKVAYEVSARFCPDLASALGRGDFLLSAQPGAAVAADIQQGAR